MRGPGPFAAITAFAGLAAICAFMLGVIVGGMKDAPPFHAPDVIISKILAERLISLRPMISFMGIMEVDADPDTTTGSILFYRSDGTAMISRDHGRASMPWARQSLFVAF